MLRIIVSENVSSIVFPLKFTWPCFGIEFIRVGGIVSLGPPVGVVCRAQARKKDGIEDPMRMFENLHFFTTYIKLEYSILFLAR